MSGWLKSSDRSLRGKWWRPLNPLKKYVKQGCSDLWINDSCKGVNWCHFTSIFCQIIPLVVGVLGACETTIPHGFSPFRFWTGSPGRKVWHWALGEAFAQLGNWVSKLRKSHGWYGGTPMTLGNLHVGLSENGLYHGTPVIPWNDYGCNKFRDTGYPCLSGKATWRKFQRWVVAMDGRANPLMDRKVVVIFGVVAVVTGCTPAECSVV